ncbi:hypothetical protein F5Y00DRAFT_272727 [Daldinia vernicosa]|uniref:uncharacterized protein n=1 Tax=Daldinia vernicosa TaxID=114800 RepID=UPI002007DB26|nr:uncharacterized protein F5Y00DRAFT_272727 [Daldinia vernicosa]KAI0845694.1 hypothetical protein F5Y00DRAFT_272727 [Daldinia vernicosa]
MESDNGSTSQITVGEALIRTKTETPPKGSGAKRVGFLRTLFKKLGLNKKTPQGKIILPERTDFEVEVEDVSFPAVNLFDDPSESFVRSDGTPLVRARSVPTTNYHRTQVLWDNESTIYSFQWKPRKVKTIGDIQNPEIEDRMQHLIMRCAMDGYEVTPQEAYDVLLLVEGAVDEAVEYMKVLRDFDG